MARHALLLPVLLLAAAAPCGCSGNTGIAQSVAAARAPAAAAQPAPASSAAPPLPARAALVPDAIVGAWWTRNTPGLHHSREESARGLRRFLLSAAKNVPSARTLLLTDEEVRAE